MFISVPWLCRDLQKKAMIYFYWRPMASCTIKFDTSPAKESAVLEVAVIFYSEVLYWFHFLICSNLMQRLLHTWTDSLGTFFQTFIIMKISKNDSNIICRSSKNITFPKISRVWLKNWAGHAHFNFKLLKGMAVF